MRNLDPALVARRGLGAFTYHLVADRELELGGHSATLEAMSRWGLPVEPHWRRCETIEEVLTFARSGRTSAGRLISKRTVWW